MTDGPSGAIDAAGPEVGWMRAEQMTGRDRLTKPRGGFWGRILRGAALLTCAAMASGAARAETAYGCRDLLTSDLLPAVEGREGVFFRVQPDLETYHWIGDESVALLARLSERLAAGGTRLIYVPVPSKALAMPDHLPPRATDLGHDPEIAATVYAGMLHRLQAAGITAIDARTALRRTASAGRAPVFATDPRLTPAGTEALARAIAEEIRALPFAATAEPTSFRVRGGEEIELASSMRTRLQVQCLSDLPPVRLPRQEVTRGAHAMSVSQPLTGDAAPPIAVLGTEIAVDPALGLAGHISAYSRFEALSYMVPGEDRRADAFGAISAYMSSPAFEAAPPRVLVWAVPVWLDLGRHGGRPLRELIALASNNCDLPLTVEPTAEGLTAAFDVPAAALRFDADDPAVHSAEFRFTSARGETRRRIIERHPDQHGTGRFAMPLDGLWPDGAVSVEIVSVTGPSPRLTLCEER